MKILHTSDWHLGKRLDQSERTEEHIFFINWLIETIISNEIDAIIIAGDIFDSGNPSNTALKLYYDFLWQVKNTPCRNVIITGGNHDSAATLNAPKELLRHFNIHVVGGAPDNEEEQIIPIKGSNGSYELVVCAVPFLRDKDIRLSVAGETPEERESRIKEGIVGHYRKLIPYITDYKKQQIPVIATGHLFAAGSQASPESEKEIHIGNLGQIYGDQFPVEFDYIALGHLHRPQMVNKTNHIRYSGSPISLSFSEYEDKKVLLVIEFEKGKLKGIGEIPVPCFRKLIRIKGSLEKVMSGLAELPPVDPQQLPAWIEIQVETEGFIYNLTEQLQELIAENKAIERLFIKQIRVKERESISELTESISLEDLTPESVFQKKCESEFPDGNYEDIKTTFEEALELMHQQ